MIPDKLLVNLKILSKIQKNGRIARSCDGIIALEADTVYQPLKRFLANDSRRQAIFEINSIVSECIATFDNVLNSKYISKMQGNHHEFQKHCDSIVLLLQELAGARGGIDALKFTYQSDPNVSSQLDIIIMKINTTIHDVEHKMYSIHGLPDNYTSHVLPVPLAPTQFERNQLPPQHDTVSEPAQTVVYMDEFTFDDTKDKINSV